MHLSLLVRHPAVGAAGHSTMLAGFFFSKTCSCELNTFPIGCSVFQGKTGRGSCILWLWVCPSNLLFSSMVSCQALRQASTPKICFHSFIGFLSQNDSKWGHFGAAWERVCRVKPPISRSEHPPQPEWSTVCNAPESTFLLFLSLASGAEAAYLRRLRDEDQLESHQLKCHPGLNRTLGEMCPRTSLQEGRADSRRHQSSAILVSRPPTRCLSQKGFAVAVFSRSR